MSAAKREIRMLSATGMLGSGFREESFLRALDWAPDFIGADSGSTDPGPYFLGSGKPQFSRRAYERDLRILLREAIPRKIPLLIGSAGMAGANPHVDFLVEVFRDLASELKLHFALAVARSEMDKEWLKAKFRKGQIEPLQNAPSLDEERIDRSSHIVAMMGPDPFIWGLEKGADVVLTGRSSDTSIFAAVPMMHGINPGPVWHAAKVLECGAASVTQRTVPDCMFAWVTDDHFIVEPPAPDYRCTPQSIASHTLYENANPFELLEPMGLLDTRDCSYQALSDRAVKVTGSRFIKASRHTLSLEGAELVGYQTVVLGGIRDPVILEQVDSWVSRVQEAGEKRVRGLFPEIETFRLNFRIYGKDGVMGPLEPNKAFQGHEALIVMEVTASTQAVANAIAATLAHFALHYAVPEWHGLISALAFPYAPAELVRGPVYCFNMNHVVVIDDEEELKRIFPLEMEFL
jgi:hypothetical protein